MMIQADLDELSDDEQTLPRRRDARARVLVVEDDEALRELIVARLRRDGFEILEAGSGDEALDVMTIASRSLRPDDDIDLLVTAARMPGTSGLEVARMLHEVASTIPVVLITAFPDGEVVNEVSRLGLYLLAKPFALDRLSDAAILAFLDALLDARHVGLPA